MLARRNKHCYHRNNRGNGSFETCPCSSCFSNLLLRPGAQTLKTNKQTNSPTSQKHYNCSHTPQTDEYLFWENCSSCGILTCFADNTTLTVASSSRNIDQIKLSEGLDIIENFLTSNKLSINRSKTTISEVMLGQKRARLPGTSPTLEKQNPDGSTKIITSQKDTKLLEITIQDNMTLTSHTESGDDALLPATRKKLGALKHLGISIPKKSKKIAD